MKRTFFIASSLVLVAALGVGCSAARDVQITGEAKSTATAAGAITIRFFDLGETAVDAPPALEVTLAKAGPFSEKLSVKGDAVRIFALSDANSDGKCEDGEPWVEVQADVAADGTVAPVTLTLTTAACPKVAAPAASK